MSATDEMNAATAADAPLSDIMLAMDVADTLRHNPELAALAGEARERQLVDRLRALYRGQGIDVSEMAVKDGLAALGESRFAYAPPKAGLAVALARLYVVRRKWLPATTAVVLMLIVFLSGYFLAWRPYRDAQIEQARIELAQTMPAEMDALYQTIFEETKIQQAANDAAAIRDRGKAAAAAGEREAATAAIADLTRIRDTLRQDYRLQIAGGRGVKWGFWTFPRVNSEATNYYLVVEALDPNGTPLSLPIRSEETGQVETVQRWGERVPEGVYRAVEADANDDGVIQHSLVGIKQFGFLDIDYVVQILGGEVTRW
ncbi:MAG: hypothetical protein HY834_05560 [Devosia nanyangense]|uniref:Uncharacterized protein n=1 Tax=Devosia nanyangense TaxID=1228055 RepID=A0A933L193_9HYPH|nr:hypothetical protein [Devosia nanyangense]